MIVSDFNIANGWVLDELLLHVNHYHTFITKYYNRVLKYSYLYLQRNVQKSTNATSTFWTDKIPEFLQVLHKFPGILYYF